MKTIERREQTFPQEEAVVPIIVKLNLDDFNKNIRTGFHTNLILTLNKDLPGGNGIYGIYKTGPSFMAFVYEELKREGKSTDFATIILTANLLANDPSNKLVFVENAPSVNSEYLGRIRDYLDVLQSHIDANPDYYSYEFMTQVHTQNKTSF